MSDNLYCPGLKANSKEYQDNFDDIFRCIWEEYTDGSWEIYCIGDFLFLREDDTDPRNMKNCPYCGKRIVIANDQITTN